MNEQLSKNFKRGEFACKCGCGKANPHPALVYALQKLRDLVAEPIYINSAHRCEEHNAKVGGVKDSLHVRGKAVDIRTNGLSPAELADMAEKITEFYHGGIGRYNTFVHLDVRGKKARWRG